MRSSKGYFQVNLAMKISHFWARLVEIAYIQSISLNRKYKQNAFFDVFNFINNHKCPALQICSSFFDLDVVRVAGGVPQQDGDAGTVCGGAAQVQVGFRKKKNLSIFLILKII